MNLDVLKPYAYVAGAVVVAALAIHAWHLGLRLDVAQARLETCRGNTSRLQASIDEQNGAISRLNGEADVARRAVEAARREAEQQAARHDQRAAELRQWRRRAGEDDCAAARRLLAEVPR